MKKMRTTQIDLMALPFRGGLMSRLGAPFIVLGLPQHRPDTSLIEIAAEGAELRRHGIRVADECRRLCFHLLVLEQTSCQAVASLQSGGKLLERRRGVTQIFDRFV